MNFQKLRTVVPGIGWPSVVGPKTAQILSMLWQLERTQWWSAEQIEQAQFEQLTVLLTHAFQFSPYYREVLKDAGYSPKMKVSKEFWNTLPVLSRDQLQQMPDKLKCQRYPKRHGKLAAASSSGSTGKPVTVYRPAITQLFYDAHNFRDHIWHGREFSGRLASIRGYVNKKKAQYPAGSREQGWARPLSMAGESFQLRVDTPVRDQVEWLQRVNPDYLLTYPTNLKAIIKIARDEGIAFERLKQITTISEPLSEEVEQLSKEVLGAPVYDMYSCQEIGVLASRCPEHDSYHVQSEHVMLEILNEDGQPCEEGQTGRVVVTDLHNFTMPLIRYELGDYAQVGASCPCGRGLPVISRILGRQRNLITLPNGEQFWPLLFLFDFNEISGSKIRQSQVVQKDLQSIEVKLAMEGELNEKQEEAIKASVIESLRHEFQVEITYCDNIERSKSGKFEEFVSLVS